MMKLPAPLLGGLEIAINQALRLDPATLARLASLSGRVIALELRGLGVTLHMAPHAGGMHLLNEFTGTPDACISGPPLAMARLGLDEQDRGPLHSGDVVISGDTEIGRRFQDILHRIDIDWEERLSRLFGDVLAHQLGNAARSAAIWGGRTADALSRDLAEYLQEEVNILPRRDEVEKFLSAVDELRSDADRLEARIKRLISHAGHEDMA